MVFLRRWLSFALVMVAVFGGCKPPSEDTAGSGGGGGGGGNPAGHVQRGKELQVVRNDLGQLAKLYLAYLTDFGRPPANWQTFKEYIQRDARTIVQAIDEGKYEVIWNVANLNSNVVLAYEKNADLRGNHVVVMGDASVKSMTTQDLQTALQNR